MRGDIWEAGLMFGNRPSSQKVQIQADNYFMAKQLLERQYGPGVKIVGLKCVSTAADRAYKEKTELRKQQGHHSSGYQQANIPDVNVVETLTSAFGSLKSLVSTLSTVASNAMDGMKEENNASNAETTGASRLDALERLVKLRDAGALTLEEFEQEKSRILNG